jgi:hypothetical protein
VHLYISISVDIYEYLYVYVSIYMSVNDIDACDDMDNLILTLGILHIYIDMYMH